MRSSARFPAHGLDSRGDSGDRVADVVQDRIDDLQPPFGECQRQRLIGEHPLGHVAEHDHPAPDPADAVEQRSRAHPDVHARRPVVVADEHVLLIDRLAAMDGPDQRQILADHRCFPIGMKGAVGCRPLVLRPFGAAHADDLLGGGVHVEEFTGGVGDHDAVADAPERGVHEIALIAQLQYRALKLGIRPLLPGDVAEHDRGPVRFAPFSGQRSAADAHVHALRLLLIANEQLGVVGGPALQGRQQRILLRRDNGLHVGLKDSAPFGPVPNVRVQQMVVADPLRAGVGEQRRQVFADGNHPLAHAVEDRLHEDVELFQAVGVALHTALRLAQRAFPRMPDERGFDGHPQLRLRERPHHVPERVARRRPLHQFLRGRVTFFEHVHHGNVEAAAKSFGYVRAGDLAGESDVDQGQVGTRLRGFRHGPAPAGSRGAHRISQAGQAAFQVRGAGVIAVDNQYLRLLVRHPACIPSSGTHQELIRNSSGTSRSTHYRGERSLPPRDAARPRHVTFNETDANLSKVNSSLLHHYRRLFSQHILRVKWRISALFGVSIISLLDNLIMCKEPIKSFDKRER